MSKEQHFFSLSLSYGKKPDGSYLTLSDIWDHIFCVVIRKKQIIRLRCASLLTNDLRRHVLGPVCQREILLEVELAIFYMCLVYKWSEFP